MSLGGLIEPLAIEKQSILEEFGTTPCNIYDIRLEIAMKLYCKVFPNVSVGWDADVTDGAYSYDRYSVVYRKDNNTFVLFKSHEDSMRHMDSYDLKESWDQPHKVSLGWHPCGDGLGSQQQFISSEDECSTPEQKKDYWERVKQKEIDLRAEYAEKSNKWASDIQVIIDRRKIYDSVDQLLTDLGYKNVNIDHGGNHLFQLYSEDLAKKCQQYKAEGLLKLRNWMLGQVKDNSWTASIGNFVNNLLGHQEAEVKPILAEHPVSGRGIYLM